jgi:hypothetical protein
MSESFLQNASSWTGNAAILLTALAAIAGIFAWVFSSRLSEIKDAALKKFREESKLSISSADRRAAEANERAALANQRAGILEKVAAEARLELGQISERQHPRTITDDQRTAFIAFMSHGPKGKVSFKCLASDNEAQAFAEQLKKLVSQVGCEVSDTVLGFIAPAVPISGIHIKIKNMESPPDHAAWLQGAFAAIGINAQGAVEGAGSTIRDDEVIIYVYGKN